jgi:hypothetical protein
MVDVWGAVFNPQAGVLRVRAGLAAVFLEVDD